MSKKLGMLFFLWIASYYTSTAQTSSLVSLGSDAKLIYTADAKGNIVPDFSGVGYMNSESAIPKVAVVKTVNPVSGDNLANIQNAINEVAALTPDANGFRGAILFKTGTYNVSDAINIKASGVVLRGEGNGTHFVATKTSQYTLFNFAGSTGTAISSSSSKAVTDAYVPIGAKQVTVANGHTFAVGNDVFIHHIPNQSWVSLLKMDKLSTLPGSDAETVNWTPSAYDVYYERKIIAVNGNIISFDAPVMDVIDPAYTTAEVVKFNDNRIQKCGLENMKISSTYTSNTDENHGWEAVEFINIKNAWASNLEIYYFGFTGVNVNRNASFITVENCKMLDAKSQNTGSRRYSFNVDGQRTLVKNCTTRGGRHDYVTGSITAGPNVFYNCTATSQQNNIGPHQRWATGILFDQIVGNGRMDVENRTTSGSGHGWAGSQIMFWNCMGSNMVLQDPQGDHRNWAIGFKGTITNVGFMTTEPLGIKESNGTFITAIPSLFKAQLNDRLSSLSIPISSEEIFNSSTTWTCPAGVTSVDVECWGAGGSGGSAVGTVGRAGGGGGGGSYVKNTVNVIPGTVYTITVGAGGTAGTTLSANCSGKQGGKTEFSGPSISAITASGGAAGTGANSHNGGGAGGVLGGVYGISITNSGSGYATAPTATISGGGGTGANSRISIASGALSFITALSQGSGYTSIPNVTITGNGRAVALVSLDLDAGGNTVIKGTSGGNGIFLNTSGEGGDGANGGAGGNAVTTEAIGLAGVIPGGGGSGGYSSGVSKVGGAGANGQLKITYNTNFPEINIRQAGVDVANNSTVNFGNVNVSASKSSTFLVENTGNSILEFSNNPRVSITGVGYSLVRDIQNNIGIAGKDSLIVKFEPSAAGVSAGFISIASNDPNENPYRINFTATGVKNDQSITFVDSTQATYGDAGHTLVANSSSGLPVSFTIVSGPGTIAGNVLSYTGAGSIVVEANQAGNATFSPATPVQQTITVLKKALTVTADNKTVTYGDAIPSLTYNFAGFVFGQTDSVVMGSPELSTLYTPSTSALEISAITAEAGTLSAANYSFTLINGQITINKKNAIVTADNKTVTYGDSPPEYTYTVTGLVSGDDASDITGSPELSSTYISSTPVSHSPLAIIAAAGSISSVNYNFNFVNGQLTINKKQAIVTADNKRVTYGDTAPAYTYSITGLAAGETAAVFAGTPLLSSSYTASTPATEIPVINISAGTLRSGNYSVAFVNGLVTINHTFPLNLEAEKASISGSNIVSTHGGFTGNGYVDNLNKTNDYIKWTTNVSGEGMATLTFRYALNNKTQDLGLTVNGIILNNVRFTKVGQWNNWGTVSVSVNLKAGINIIQLNGSGTAGPSVDNLLIESQIYTNGSSAQNLVVNNFTRTQIPSPMFIEVSSEQKFQVYPVPAKDDLNVTFSTNNDGKVVITLIDMQGRVSYRKSSFALAGSNTFKVDINSMLSGNYLLSVNASGISNSRMITVAK